MSDYTYTLFSLLFLASSFVSFFVAYLAWQKKNERGAKELAMLMVASGIYSFFVIFETASPTLEDKILWSKIAYLGAVTTPLFYAFFVFRFVGKDKLLTRKIILLLSIVPFIVLILTLTNDYHSLIWAGYSPISAKTNLLEYYHGIGFWIGNVGYNYLLFLTSSIYLVSFIINHRADFKFQGTIIFIASMCPWIASVFYITSKNIVPGFDLVPLSMVLSGILLAIAIFGNKFLDLVPVARETLFESLKEGIIVLDSIDRVQDINKWAREYLGINKKDVTGIDFKILELKAETFRNIVLNPAPRQIVELIEGKAKLHYIVEKHDITNYPGSVLVIIRDNSENIKREQELLSAIEKAEESDKMKTSFLANLSHEIRTPLNIITGFIDFLQTSEVTKEEKAIYMDLLKKNNDRILNTLNDIVEIAKIESNQITLEESKVNLNEIIDYLYNINLKAASEKNLELSCFKGLANEDSLIIIDRPKLTSVFSKLINNALKFTNVGKIEFGYLLEDNKLLFYVKDTGIGIPADRLSVIFNRFIQVEQSMNRPYEGTGLGLSIVKAYVNMMGSNVFVRSEEDKGCYFYFQINYRPVIFPAGL